MSSKRTGWTGHIVQRHRRDASLSSRQSTSTKTHSLVNKAGSAKVLPFLWLNLLKVQGKIQGSFIDWWLDQLHTCSFCRSPVQPPTWSHPETRNGWSSTRTIQCTFDFGLRKRGSKWRRGRKRKRERKGRTGFAHSKSLKSFVIWGWCEDLHTANAIDSHLLLTKWSVLRLALRITVWKAGQIEKKYRRKVEVPKAF